MRTLREPLPMTTAFRNNGSDFGEYEDMLLSFSTFLKSKFTWKCNILFALLISSYEKASGLKFYFPLVTVTFLFVCLFDLKKLCTLAMNWNSRQLELQS